LLLCACANVVLIIAPCRQSPLRSPALSPHTMQENMATLKQNMATKGEVGQVLEILSRSYVKDHFGSDFASPFLVRSVQDIVEMMPQEALIAQRAVQTVVSFSNDCRRTGLHNQQVAR